MILGEFSCWHKRRPSLRAQSLDKKLLAFPNLLEKPITQLPFSSLTTPPPPAKPITPFVAPSVLSFSHPILGFPQHILLTIPCLRCFHLPAQWTNSLDCIMISCTIFGLVPVFLKTSWFLCFQMIQMVNKNRESQGGQSTMWLVLSRQLEKSHSLVD